MNELSDKFQNSRDEADQQSPQVENKVDPLETLGEESSMSTKVVSSSARIQRTPAPEKRPQLQSDMIAIYLPGREAPFRFKGKNEITFGRGDLAHISKPDVDLASADGMSLGVSREHAVIRRVDERYFIEDLNSTNGTWLNENRLAPGQPYPINNGDQIRLGQLLVLVYFSFSNKKFADTIYLTENRLVTGQLKSGVEVPFLLNKLVPYLNALKCIQQVLDDAQEESSQVHIQGFGVHRDGKRIEVNIRGASQAIETIHDKISPLQQEDNGIAQEAFRTRLITEDGDEVVHTDVKQFDIQDEEYIEMAMGIILAVAPRLPDNDLDEFMEQLLPHINFVLSSELMMTK